MGVISMADDLSGLGLKAAVAAAGGEGAAVGAEAEQAELFAEIEGDLRAMDGPLSDLSPRRAGRPKGAQNRRTKDMVAFLRANYRDPLIGLAEIANADTLQVAARMDADALAVLKVQAGCFRELAEYMHTKQPRQVDLGDGSLATIVLNIGGDGGHHTVAPEVIDMTKENQGLSDYATGGVERAELNGSPETQAAGGFQASSPLIADQPASPADDGEADR